MAVFTWKRNNDLIEEQRRKVTVITNHLTAIQGKFTPAQWDEISREKTGFYYLITDAMYYGYVTLDERLLKTVQTPAQATALLENMRTLCNAYQKEVAKRGVRPASIED